VITMNKGELFRRKKVFTRGQKSFEERVAEIERKIQKLDNGVKFTRGQKSFEERVAEIERKIQKLENRVKALERSRGRG